MKSLELHVCTSSEYYNFSPSALAKEYLLYVLCAGEFSYEPGYDLQRTSFDSFLMEVILEGKVHIETEGETLTACAGQVVLLNCSKPHRYHSDCGWRALWVHFDGAAARGYFSLILRQNGRAFFTHRQQRVYESLRVILDMFQRGLPLSETRMALCLTQALTAMAEPTGSSTLRDHSSLVHQAVARISQSIGREPAVGELAREVGLSEYHFIRVFKSVMGMTPRQYVIAARMNHAKYLLKTTALPVSEIGGMVGYLSESMFTAAFHRTQGMTPTRYRTEQNT